MKKQVQKDRRMTGCGRRLCEKTLTAALLAETGVAAAAAATAVMPWTAGRGSSQSVTTIMAMLVLIFTTGICLGCCLQCIVRRWCSRRQLQLGRPVYGLRTSPQAAQADPVATTTPPAVAQEVAQTTAPTAATPPAVTPMPKASAKRAAAKPRSTAKSATMPPRASSTGDTTTGEDEAAVACPMCGDAMRFMRAGRGGFFYGCTAYPVCKGTRRPG